MARSEEPDSFKEGQRKKLSAGILGNESMLNKGKEAGSCERKQTS